MKNFFFPFNTFGNISLKKSWAVNENNHISIYSCHVCTRRFKNARHNIMHKILSRYNTK